MPLYFSKNSKETTSLNNEGKTFPVEKIVMKTALNTITLYYSILRVL